MSIRQTNTTKLEGKGQARPRFDWPTLRQAIEFYEKEHLCYLPAGWGHKKPSVNWEEYQTRLPTMAEKAEWFHEGRASSVGVLCGGVSGGLVILAFNDQNGARDFFGEERWQKLPQATFITKSVRGHHVWLRSDTPIKSQKVGKGKNESWLEIRSDGNFTVAPPSLHPSGVLYQTVGVDHIYKPDDLAGFIAKRLSELGLKARGSEEAPREKAKPSDRKRPERSDEFNALAIEKLLECCAFIQHCRDNAATLSEPHWWPMVHVLAVFGEPGRKKIHELSQPYPRYTEKETEQKIEEARKAADKDVGPHTCLFIEQDLGFDCPENCLAKKLGTKSPAGLASKVATHAGFRNNGLPVIVVNNRQLRDITKDALTALYEANVLNPKIFTRGGNLVRVSIDEKQNPYIDPLTESSLRGLLTRAADFIKVNTNAKGEVVETKVSPPLDVVRDTLSLRGWQLPPLLSIIEVPVICSDGTIIDKIGYDAKTCLYYHPSPELRVPPVPDTPTESDVKAAKALLLEVICNFPFDSEASGANAVAAMLTPIVRPVIDGLVPLAVFDKPQPGTGASLLSDVIAFIATGQTAGMLGGQRKEEEWRKAITTILLYGRSVICIDNIDGDLDSTSLSTVLTARVWRDRILGRNEEVLLPNMSTWIANGNNIRLAGDLPRRAYRARLDAQLAQPWLRQPSAFKHPDLIKWVRQKRGDIIAAMLTVARSWVVAGKPAPQALVTIGSYESFCEVLGGILSFMEVKGFLGNLQQMYSEMDVETPQWGGFLEAWQEVFGDSGVTVAEVTKKLNENEGFAAALPGSLADKDEKGYNRKLGGALARRKDVRFPNGLMIQAGEIKHHATAWKIVKAKSELPFFSFGGELGELGHTPRECEDEKENDKDKYIDKEWVYRNSPDSPLDTKKGELAKGNRPTTPCPTCGGTDWWQRVTGELVCQKCHPDPNKTG